jgi:putative tricarboxylic transport membrane protein
MLLGTVGIDPVFGEPRFTFGLLYLMDGFDYVIAGMGLFGIAEVLSTLDARRPPVVPSGTYRDLLPSRDEWRRCRPAILRGTGIGFLVGTLPGGGAVVSSFLAYAVEKGVSKRPEAFGTGMVEGVTAPEAANNAASTSSFIPLLTLGIPGNATTAMIFVALLVHGVQPGPFLVQEHPQVFWGVIASMYVANVLLLGLNLPLVWLWARLLRVPYPWLAGLVVTTCVAAAYGVRGAAFDVGVMATFGALGFLLRRGGFPVAPLLLAMILGRILERSFLQSLQMSAGDFLIFVERPVAAALLAIAAIFLVAAAVRRPRRGAILP